MKPKAKFLNSLFEIAHVEFQTYDLTDHKVMFSSGVTRRLLGYSEQEYFNLSKNFYKSIIHPDDFQMVQQTIDRILRAKNGEIFEMTVRLRKLDGLYIWVYSRQMIYERKHDGHVLTIIREAEDITKLVQIQNELQEKVEQLKAVSHKNSHLLRSPVASIIGLVNLIEEQDIASEHNGKYFIF